ncbi:MAG TPA: 2-amino-4-hydroxy-6-hydroxymethyldihydropteridine diphosphokinase [Nocardioidaceae bacterium]|jgi:2-amino-4-hydroxy-6-hydroxymethyldihydropteridine diphosphokinase
MTETPNPHIIDPDTLTGEMRPIRPAVISLGSNVGDRLANLQGAVDALADTPEVHLVTVSAVYETAPVDAPDGSPDFLNAIVLADTTLSVTTLLDRAQAIEAAFGRERAEFNAPRTLDVDLIVVGDRLSDTEELVLPHPRAHDRAFVLVPWQDVDEQATIPGKGKIADLLSDLDTSGVVRRDDLELEY